MKRLILTAVFSFFIGITVSAQPKAVGLKIGPVAEFSYQHYVGNSFFEVEAGADFMGETGIRGGFSWNWVFARPSWTAGEWAWYAGPAAAIGYVNDVLFTVNGTVKQRVHEMGFMTGIGAQLGCEYTFPFRLQLSAALRPVMGMHIVDGPGYTDDGKNHGSPETYQKGLKVDWYRYGLLGLLPTLGVHYSF